MTTTTNHNWVKWSLTVLCAVMLTGSITFSVLNGVGYRKFGVTLIALLFLALLHRPARTIKIYKDVAVISLNTVVLLVLLEGAAGLLIKVTAHRADTSNPDLSANEQEAWKAGYSRESTLSQSRYYVPYVIWKNKPFTGEYINIDSNGNRVTPGAKCEKDSYVVFVFGGSTVWGTGVPDWGTIPSYLQTELSNSEERSVCVRNLGQNGWVSTQSVIELLRHLQEGEAPNLVIFYDGFNDVQAAWGEAADGSDQTEAQLARSFKDFSTPNGFKVLAESTSMFQLARQIVSKRLVMHKPPDSELQSVREAVVRTYLANLRTVKSLSDEFKFDYAFFWQPQLAYGSKPLAKEEKGIVEKYNQPEWGAFRKFIMTVYPQVQSATRDFDHLFFLADTFNTETEWLYLDDAHLLPSGNQKIAKSISAVLRSNPQLKSAHLKL